MLFFETIFLGTNDILHAFAHILGGSVTLLINDKNVW